MIREMAHLRVRMRRFRRKHVLDAGATANATQKHWRIRDAGFGNQLRHVLLQREHLVRAFVIRIAVENRT